MAQQQSKPDADGKRAEINVITQDGPSTADPKPRGGDKGKPSAAADDKVSSKQPDSATGDDKQQTPDDEQTRQRRHDRKAERRIAKLTRKLSDYEQSTQALTSTIEAMKAQIDELKQGGKAPEALKEPNPDDFKSAREYKQALDAYNEAKQGQRKPSKPNEPEEKPGKRQRDPELETFVEKGEKRLGQEFTAALKEGGNTPVNKAMAEFMFDSEYGPEIYVHLVNNPDQARKIFNTALPRRLEKLMDELEEQAKKGELDVDAFDDDDEPKGKKDDKDDDDELDDDKPQGKKKSTSRAPEPPSSTRDKGSAKAKKDLYSVDSTEDYIAQRRAQEQARLGLHKR